MFFNWSWDSRSVDAPLFTVTQTQAMITLRLFIFALLALLPALSKKLRNIRSEKWKLTDLFSDAAPGRVFSNNNLSESFEQVSDSEVDASPSESDEDDEQVPLLPNPQQDFNLADHIKPKKGEKNVIGGKFKCDSNGCHAVDEEVFDESLWQIFTTNFLK